MPQRQRTRDSATNAQPGIALNDSTITLSAVLPCILWHVTAARSVSVTCLTVRRRRPRTPRARGSVTVIGLGTLCTGT